MKYDFVELEACADCMIFAVNGDEPDDDYKGEGWSVEAFCKGAEPFTNVSLNDDTEGHFSHMSCDLCGTSLGGDRYAMLGHVPIND